MISGQFIGNQNAVVYFHAILGLSDSETKPKSNFILLTGPQNIGKMTLIESVLDQLVEPNYQLADLMIIRDLSDQWLALKESNDKLTGTSHSIKVDSDDKKVDIKLADGTIYRDWGARDIIERLQRSPTGKRKLLVMENIERMNNASANALLKSLEEPLEDRLIICTSSDPHRLLDTIKSRATIVQFQPVDNSEFGMLNAQFSMGRPGLAYRLEHNENYKQLAQDVDKLTSDWYDKSLISERQAILTSRNDMGLLNLGLDMVLYEKAEKAENGLSVEKIMLAKKYLESNVGVGNIILDLVMS